MNTYLVATIARYVLVDARDEAEARELAMPALRELYADVRRRLGREVLIEIHTVRLATKDEIELWKWHHEMLKQGKRRTNDDC